jgi:hypothetical protein
MHLRLDEFLEDVWEPSSSGPVGLTFCEGVHNMAPYGQNDSSLKDSCP